MLSIPVLHGGASPRQGGSLQVHHVGVSRVMKATVSDAAGLSRLCDQHDVSPYAGGHVFRTCTSAPLRRCSRVMDAVLGGDVLGMPFPFLSRSGARCLCALTLRGRRCTVGRGSSVLLNVNLPAVAHSSYSNVVSGIECCAAVERGTRWV
ncbi:hypothetical protein K466DRAFT_312503 [Polyporus arcularius HHB13444]|uniref:Uncharacterized protein n=1 Tax=Polyporus arcularius HHB13444 TaxID=1314778 RepID=A0A5C3P1C8_9APHY|nr:hypothetical protein K466DRAFT_312503 [Polyporus arcularius HHB13444]